MRCDLASERRMDMLRSAGLSVHQIASLRLEALRLDPEQYQWSLERADLALFLVLGIPTRGVNDRLFPLNLDRPEAA